MHALPYTLADLHWMQITEATGNYNDDSTSQKKNLF